MGETTERQVVKVQQDTQDRWSGWYNFTARFRYPYISPLRKIISVLVEHNVARRSDWRVLEFGFGHGHLIFWFKPPTRVYGIELSKQAVETAMKWAEKKGYPEFEFKKTDLDRSIYIDFGKEFFDLVICSHTLEHVWDDQALLGEFYRVLKPNGLLLVAVPHDLNHREVLADQHMRRNPNFPDSSYHVSNYNVETLEHVAKMSNFTIEHSERFDSVLSWRCKKWPRSIAMLFSISLPILPYYLFKILDSKAERAGYPGMQALIFCCKKG